jgi:tRNA dimethylallyltransferase
LNQLSEIIQLAKGRIPVVVGPTASGKTDLAIQLAQKINSEIISVDSRQIFHGFRIGTAQPGRYQLGLIRHHLIDVLDPDALISSGKYADWVNDCENDIISRNKSIILTGGSFLYLQSITQGIIQEVDSDPEVRQEIYQYIESIGLDSALEEIKSFDPKYGAIIHKNDTKRMVRALEIYKVTGKAPTEIFLKQKILDKEKRNKYFYISISTERDALYERINKRTDEMISSGWLDEVNKLLNSGISRDSHPMQSLGYRQLLDVIKELTDIDSAIEIIKAKTRQFAKKQLTWLNKIDIDFEYKLSNSNNE